MVNTSSEFLSPAQLAEHLGVPVASVRSWRYKGIGPRGVKVGRHVRYRRSDIDAWLEAQSDPRPAA